MFSDWHSHTMQTLAKRGQSQREVWYWADAMATLNNDTGVVSHVFSNGMGKVRYASPLTTMPNNFRGSAVLSVSLPSGVTARANGAFYNCITLALLTFLGTPDSIASAFHFCSALTSISVPWSEGEVSGAPWGAPNATITYNYTPQ